MDTMDWEKPSPGGIMQLAHLECAVINGILVARVGQWMFDLTSNNDPSQETLVLYPDEENTFFGLSGENPCFLKNVRKGWSQRQVL